MRKMQLAIAALAGTLLFVALPDWSATGARTELTSIGPGRPTPRRSTGKFLGERATGALLRRRQRPPRRRRDPRYLPPGPQDRHATRLLSVSTSGQPANGNCADDLAASPPTCASSPSPARPRTSAAGPRGLPAGSECCTTALISKTSQGDPGSGFVHGLAVSASGRYVTFATDSDNLPGSPGTTDAYVRDRRTARPPS